jgi:hypothetical protein
MSVEELRELYAEYKACKERAKVIKERLEDEDNIYDVTDLDIIPEPPLKVVQKYRDYLDRYGYIDVPSEFLTVERVGKVMLEYVRWCHVFSYDHYEVAENGWENHALRDTNPRCAIREMIEESYEDNGS